MSSPDSMIEQWHHNEMVRLARAKMRLVSFMYATGGWGYNEYDPGKGMSPQEMAAYSLLMSKLSRELNQAYANALRSGVVADDKAAVREAIEHRFATDVTIMDLLHIDHEATGWKVAEEEQFRREIKEWLDAL
jgi:hypothetical protein